MCRRHRRSTHQLNRFAVHKSDDRGKTTSSDRTSKRRRSAAESRAAVRSTNGCGDWRCCGNRNPHCLPFGFPDVINGADNNVVCRQSPFARVPSPSRVLQQRSTSAWVRLSDDGICILVLPAPLLYRSSPTTSNLPRRPLAASSTPRRLGTTQLVRPDTTRLPSLPAGLLEKKHKSNFNRNSATDEKRDAANNGWMRSLGIDKAVLSTADR